MLMRAIRLGIVWREDGGPVPRAQFSLGDKVRTLYGNGIVVGVMCLPDGPVRYDVYHANPRGCRGIDSLRYEGVPEGKVKAVRRKERDMSKEAELYVRKRYPGAFCDESGGTFVIRGCGKRATAGSRLGGHCQSPEGAWRSAARRLGMRKEAK